MSFKSKFAGLTTSLVTAAFVSAALPAAAQNEIIVRVERGDLTADVQFPGDANNWQGTYDRVCMFTHMTASVRARLMKNSYDLN